ncbi:hypothetical protein AMS57_02115 [Pseudoalteromonas undina]|uniref:hypothetical protein n=1 Tax=Pseudoalteromonas undina TaxID=43660 RepID=UPI0006BAF3D5|nr:hypothetical protein [Pseudoalteromonas undina]KPH92343.1 hypothetical protein AMS57_02115 [Pseudoalteromonas undina]
MSKIVRAANAMCGNKELITNVIRAEQNELYFIYNQKFKWSIIKDDDDDEITLHFYPDSTITLEELTQFDSSTWSDYKQYISYSSHELGTREAQETFNELYNSVQEMVFGMEDVLDEIISSDTSDITF